MAYEILSVIGYRMGLWSGSAFFPGLSGFRLYFTESDHKIMSLSVGGTSATSPQPIHDYTIGIFDQSSVLEHEDVFRGWSKFLNLGTLTEEFVMGAFDGRGTGTLRIPAIQPGESFVLRGFTIRQTRAHDHNIRKIGLRLNAGGDGIDVTFEDNSPDDDGFECKVVYGRVVNASEGFNMRTQFFGPFTVEQNFAKQATISKEVSGETLLTGFSFEYQDTDHFIREIKIDPEADDAFEVIFTDNEADNEVKVVLDYMLVRTF
jgi:hypothetical protein